MHNLAELLLAKGEQEKSEELRKEIAALIQQEYKPETWSDEEVVSTLSADVRLGQGTLTDHRPTLDDLQREKQKQNDNLRNSGMG
jgi:DNA-directed RNA polymerase specialized sigma54-like protein